MGTVTQRIREISQPIGGFLNLKSMDTKVFNDSKQLNCDENIHPTTIGTIVDYMTRFLTGTKIEKAFEISLKGAEIKADFREDDSVNQVTAILNKITGLDDESIINACKAVSFDVWYRSINDALQREYAFIIPDEKTISNIKIMLERSISFFKEYGPVVDSGFTFEKDGYSSIVDKGDGDFLTKNGLWDYKVSKSEPKPKDTLQILMYYIMGQHSEKPEFSDITCIGIFNPRLNKAYVIDTNKLPSSLISLVENDIICYDPPDIYAWEYDQVLKRSLHIGRWIIPAATHALAVSIGEKASELNCVLHTDVSNQVNKKNECYVFMYEDDIDGHISLIRMLKKHNLLLIDKDGKYKDFPFKLDYSEFWPSYIYEGVFDSPLRLSHIFNLDTFALKRSFLKEKGRLQINRTIEEKVEKYTKENPSCSGVLSPLCKGHKINGKYLNEQMNEKGITTVDLAKISNVKEETVRSWIKGKSRPILGTVMKLCVHLNLEEDKLILK